jgi:hypothetical protein
MRFVMSEKSVRRRVFETQSTMTRTSPRAESSLKALAIHERDAQSSSGNWRRPLSGARSFEARRSELAA